MKKQSPYEEMRVIMSKKIGSALLGFLLTEPLTVGVQ